MVSHSSSIRIHYKFTLSDKTVKEIDLQLDAKTLALGDAKRSNYPEWTRLSYKQCTNCPLREEEHPRCPIAARLVDVVDLFKDVISYEEAEVEISTEARTYKKHTAVQHGLSSLIGIYMVTSGCPIMDKLRPLVRTHLPFATLEETTYRAISMYLVSQYFMRKRGKEPDWDFKKLANIYEDIQTVNKGFHDRLASLGIQDAGLNAIVHLDCYAQFTNMMLLEKGLDQIESLFHAYLESEK